MNSGKKPPKIDSAFKCLNNSVLAISDTLHFYLSDGSKVSLDKQMSEISYSKNGEELIVNNDTIHQKSGPQNELMNKVVISYGQKSMIVLSDGTRVCLNAGSQLIYPAVFTNKTRQVMFVGEASTRMVDVSKYVSWIEGMLEFEKVDLERALKQVERFYNVKIHLADETIGNYKLSGKLDLKDEPEEVLNVIKLTVPIDWQKKSNEDFEIIKK